MEMMTAGSVGLELWRLAKRWRRRADAELSPLGLTLMHWWILEATRMLILDTGDAVSQAAVALRMDVDKMTLSHAMLALQRRGFVDRGPDMTGAAYRIVVTSSGELARRQGGARVEAASLAAFGRCYERLAAALRLQAP
jgi:DNA-binding MarR family transcriptional regulator